MRNNIETEYLIFISSDGKKSGFDIFNDRTLIRSPSLPFVLMKDSIKVGMKCRLGGLKATRDQLKKATR